MVNEQTSEVQNNEEPVTPEAPEARKDEETVDNLPDWARKSLTKANEEAAKYRTELREAQSNLAKAKTQEEFETAVAELNGKIASLERSLLIRDNTEGLPKEIVEAEWVTWPDTEEGVKKVADDLRKLVAAQATGSTPPVGQLKGGLNPETNGQPQDDMDPASLAKRARYFRNE